MPLPRMMVRLGLPLLASIGLAPLSAQGQERTETVFREARAYTVRIRTQIETPFLEDERGSFSGAGFLVDAGRRWVLTNAHVVGQSPSTVQAAFSDGTFRPARKIYVDSFADVAVLEVADDGQHHPVAPVSCSESPRVGEGIGAFGHPLGMPFTGTRGIVSGLTDQMIVDLVQIDATVDHGNSGGPVIRLADGKVVGIATAGAGGDKSDRLNFATPMVDVCRILELLKQGVPPEPAVLEFSLLIDNDERTTLEIGRVYDATRWPFEPGDRITTVDARPVKTLHHLMTALRGRKGPVPIRVTRAGKQVVVQARPRFRTEVMARRAISLDGALIARGAFEDSAALGHPARLVVQSVEPGSTAETLGLAERDIIETIDGRSFGDIETLAGHLHGREAGTPVRLVLRRMSPSESRWFDYHMRELPGEETSIIEQASGLLSSTPAE